MVDGWKKHEGPHSNAYKLLLFRFFSKPKKVEKTKRFKKEKKRRNKTMYTVQKRKQKSASQFGLNWTAVLFGFPSHQLVSKILRGTHGKQFGLYTFAGLIFEFSKMTIKKINQSFSDLSIFKTKDKTLDTECQVTCDVSQFHHFNDFFGFFVFCSSINTCHLK